MKTRIQVAFGLHPAVKKSQGLGLTALYKVDDALEIAEKTEI